jgi:hypothetical protein
VAGIVNDVLSTINAELEEVILLITKELSFPKLVIFKYCFSYLPTATEPNESKEEETPIETFDLYLTMTIPEPPLPPIAIPPGPPLAPSPPLPVFASAVVPLDLFSVSFLPDPPLAYVTIDPEIE